MKIGEFATLLMGMTVALHEAEAELVKEVAQHVAESTLEDKRRHGYPVQSPLLRTGEHIRDTIEVSEPSARTAGRQDDGVCRHQFQGRFVS